MKKIIFTVAILAGTLQAQSIVHYDTKTVKEPSINKPNHPGFDLYTTY